MVRVYIYWLFDFDIRTLIWSERMLYINYYFSQKIMYPLSGASKKIEESLMGQDFIYYGLRAAHLSQGIEIKRTKNLSSDLCHSSWSSVFALCQSILDWYVIYMTH